jgi:uncharacterized protein
MEPGFKYQDFQIFVKPAGASCNLGCSYCYYTEAASTGMSGSGPASRIMTASILEEYIIQHFRACEGSPVIFSWHGGEPTLAGIDFFRKAVELQKKYLPPGGKFINGIQTNAILLNDEWCRFFADEGFFVGVSMDGPEEYHDLNRKTRNGKPTFKMVVESFKLLNSYGIANELLCVVHAGNVREPLKVYRSFRELGVKYMTFLPLVIRLPGKTRVSSNTVPSGDFGDFLISIFDEWVANDIGNIKVQLFEEAARTAFNQDHTLCLFKQTCGRVPVITKNGDLYSCDHYVDAGHLVGNISDSSIDNLLNSRFQKEFGRLKLDTLPRYCLSCEVRPMCNGECPRNRFMDCPDGEPGLNYLCPGYKKFFNHCLPFVNAIAAAWKREASTG